MSEQLYADKILNSVDAWRRSLYPVWDTERRIEVYANGGPPPTEDDTCEDDIVPLGFAQTTMRKEMAPLLDPLTMKPGIIDALCTNPLIKMPERTVVIQGQLNEALNKIAMPRLTPTLTNAAGRATVTGRATLYRKSPNDWVLKNGRIIHPKEAGVDLLDSEFREWAFAEKITLRDIEERIKVSSSGKYGWSKEGLQKLKLWIMAAESQKYVNGSDEMVEWMREYDPQSWLAVDLTSASFADPVDVYWYFRKNGKLTKDDPRYGGHEEIDLYCISRFGGETQVERKMKDQFTEVKGLHVGYSSMAQEHLTTLEAKRMTSSRAMGLMDDAEDDDEEGDDAEEEDDDFEDVVENERLLFYLPGIFRSIEECLILHVDDASISGDQRLKDVRGTGKTAMPKLAVMEGLLTSMIEGLSFGAQVNWSVSPGIGDEYLKQLQRGGLQSGQAFPAGIQPMAKNNTFSGFGQAMSAIRLLDTGISADSSANSQGTFGGNQAEFAAQANADLNNRMQIAGRRMENWLITLDKVAELVGRTLCRHWPEQKSSFPCYPDASRLRLNLSTMMDVHEDEWDAMRWTFGARRLAGSVMKSQAVQMNAQMIQLLGGIMPSALPFFAYEILRATYGDTIALQITKPQDQALQSQRDRANQTVTVIFVTGIVKQPEPMDDPMVHAEVAVSLAENRTKAAMTSGMTTQAEVVGVMAVLKYAISQIGRVPESIGKPAIDRVIQIGDAIQSIPVQTPKPEGAMTEKDQAEIALKNRNQDRLMQQLELQKTEKGVRQMVDMRKLSNAEQMQVETQKGLAVQRAKTYSDIEKDAFATNESATAAPIEPTA